MYLIKVIRVIKSKELMNINMVNIAIKNFYRDKMQTLINNKAPEAED